MCEFVENVGRILEPLFGIGVAKGHGIFGHSQNLLNLPWEDEM